MSVLDILAKIRMSISKPGKSLVSFFHVKGKIDAQTYIKHNQEHIKLASY